MFDFCLYWIWPFLDGFCHISSGSQDHCNTLSLSFWSSSSFLLASWKDKLEGFQEAHLVDSFHSSQFHLLPFLQDPQDYIPLWPKALGSPHQLNFPNQYRLRHHLLHHHPHHPLPVGGPQHLFHHPPQDHHLHHHHLHQRNHHHPLLHQLPLQAAGLAFGLFY